MFTKEEVTKLVAEVKEGKGHNPNLGNLDMSTLEIGAPYCFGLAVDAYDPVSGHVFSICRPHRADLPDHPEIFMTAGQVAAHVSSLRTKKAHDDRALGVWPDMGASDPAVAAKKAANDQAQADYQNALVKAAGSTPLNKAENDSFVAAKKAAADKAAADYKAAVDAAAAKTKNTLLHTA